MAPTSGALGIAQGATSGIEPTNLPRGNERGNANLPAMMQPGPLAAAQSTNEHSPRGANNIADSQSQTMQASTWNSQGNVPASLNPSCTMATRSQEPRGLAPEPWEQTPSQQGSKAANPSTPRRVLGSLGPVRIVQANPDSQPTNVTSGRPRSALHIRCSQKVGSAHRYARGKMTAKPWFAQACKLIPHCATKVSNGLRCLCAIHREPQCVHSRK